MGRVWHTKKPENNKNIQDNIVQYPEVSTMNFIGSLYSMIEELKKRVPASSEAKVSTIFMLLSQIEGDITNPKKGETENECDE